MPSNMWDQLYPVKYMGDSEGQGSLACSSPWGCKELDMTERLNNKLYLKSQIFFKYGENNMNYAFKIYISDIHTLLHWVLNQITIIQNDAFLPVNMELITHPKDSEKSTWPAPLQCFPSQLPESASNKLLKPRCLFSFFRPYHPSSVTSSQPSTPVIASV